MQETIYATFADASDAERAAGALLDNSVHNQDLTIIRRHDGATKSVAGPWQVQPDTTEDRPMDTTELFDRLPKDADGNIIDGGLEFGDDVDTRVTNMPGNIESGMTGMPLSTPSYAASPNEPAYTSAVNTSLDSQAAEIDSERAAKQGITVTTAGDAGIGAAKGAGWGLGIGAVAALVSLFIPGVGLVIGGGALATAIGAAAAATGAGAVAGALTGYLKDQGFEEQDSKRVEEVVAGGGALLSVTLPSGNVEAPQAWEIIEKYHGSPLSVAEGVRTSYLA